MANNKKPTLSTLKALIAEVKASDFGAEAAMSSDTGNVRYLNADVDAKRVRLASVRMRDNFGLDRSIAVADLLAQGMNMLPALIRAAELVEQLASGNSEIASLERQAKAIAQELEGNLPDLKTARLVRQIEGSELSLEVWPCSWMYPGSGLHVRIDMKDGGSATIRAEDTSFETATMDDLNRLFDQVKLVKCKCCGKPAFDPATCSTNREGKCEACFMAALNAKFEADRKKEAEKLAKLDAKYKAQGYTHRVNAWVHPKAGGDDYQVQLWTIGSPKPEEIKAILKRRKSQIDNDYTVVEI